MHALLSRRMAERPQPEPSNQTRPLIVPFCHPAPCGQDACSALPKDGGAPSTRTKRPDSTVDRVLSATQLLAAKMHALLSRRMAERPQPEPSDQTRPLSVPFYHPFPCGQNTLCPPGGLPSSLDQNQVIRLDRRPRPYVSQLHAAKILAPPSRRMAERPQPEPSDRPDR